MTAEKMKVPLHNAEHIVRELHSVIGRDINFMDENGIIIASTDPSRIGQEHAGARQIIRQNLTQLLVERDDDAAGVKEGANYPLVIAGNIVGVIGITGEYKETAKFGKIAQKMTEILMTELSVKEHRDFQESQKNRYLMEWLGNENTLVNRSFVIRGRAMQIDITLPRRFFLISVLASEESRNTMEDLTDAERAEEKIKNYVRRRDERSLYMKSASTLLFGVSNRSDADMRSLTGSIRSLIKDYTGIRIVIGVDGGYHSYEKAYLSYHQAVKALQSALRLTGDQIRFYQDITMEVFMDEISSPAKKEYIQKLFKGFETDEISAVLEMLEILYSQDGSISRASELLHMHKNTLQYKLRKVCERTGYDARSLRSAPLFAMAIEFYYDLSREL